MIEDWHHTEQIVIQFNQQYFSLDTGSAPDFMDKEKVYGLVDGRALNLNLSQTVQRLIRSRRCAFIVLIKNFIGCLEG